MEYELCFVYWIRRNLHSDIKSEGYVGVSNYVDKRFKEHKCSSTNKNLIENLSSDDIVIDTVFIGNIEECYNYEISLRPKWNIGWNVAPGGKGGLFKDRQPKSTEHRKNISIALKGKIRSTKHALNISIAKKGVPQSIESNAKRAATMLGQKRGPYNRKVRNDLVL